MGKGRKLKIKGSLGQFIYNEWQLRQTEYEHEVEYEW